MACKITPFISLFLCPHLVLCPNNFSACLSNILLHVKEGPGSVARPEAWRPKWSFLRGSSQSLDRCIDNSITELPIHAAVADTVRLCRHNHERRKDRSLERRKIESSGTLFCSPEKRLH